MQRRRVHLSEGDSRSWLKRFAVNPSIPTDDVFFYLDAHWQDDLPLKEELDIIFAMWTRPVVMIDEFRVPDSEYGFDDYGPDKRLDLRYIASVLSTHRVSAFFPKAAAAEETGSKRGSIVLCTQTAARQIGAKVQRLVRHS